MAIQVSETKGEGLSRELEVTVERQDIDQRIDEKLQEYAGNISLPGFRPGKVPLKILRNRYGQAVMGEVVEQMVNETSQQALQDQGITPALQPNIQVKSFDEGADLVYTMSVEVLPDFEVGDLSGIEVEKPITSVTDDMVEDTLQRIAQQNRTTTPIEDDRPLQEGDVAVIDFRGQTEDGEEFPGMQAEDQEMEIGAGEFIPGFEEQLTGKKAGEDVKVELTFPDEYGMPGLAGKPAVFDVTIKEIRAPQPAELDDDLAAKVGMETIDQVRDAIRQQMESQYEDMSRTKAKRRLMDKMDAMFDFELPPGMLDMEYQNVVQQVAHDKAQREDPDHTHDHHHSHDESELDESEREELKGIAERRVRLGLVLSEIGRQNNIQVGDQELQQAVIQEAQRYPGQEREVFEYFQQNQQAVENLRAPLFEDKVVDYLLELANVSEKEVTAEELAADDDETGATANQDEETSSSKSSSGSGQSKSKSGSSSKSGGSGSGKTAKSKSSSSSSKSGGQSKTKKQDTGS